MFYGKYEDQKSAVLVLARHAETLLIGPDYHGWSDLTNITGVSNGRLMFP